MFFLDTVILIGGYSAKFPEVEKRMIFGAGAGSFSVLWFYGLAYFSSKVSAVFNNPKAMKNISIASGSILIILAVKLGLDVAGWLFE